MFLRLLLVVLTFLYASNVVAFNPVCGVVLSPDSVYENIKTAVNRHTKSSDLTFSQRAMLENLIEQLERKVNKFDSSYNEILAPYGTAFLPRLKEKLEDMSAEFRRKNWQVINELRRYLGNGELRFRDLDIISVLASLKTSSANRFIHNTDHIYFGMDYFVNTLKVSVEYGSTGIFRPVQSINIEVGYNINSSQVSHNLGFDVRTLPIDIANEVANIERRDEAEDTSSGGPIILPEVLEMHIESQLNIDFYPGSRIAALTNLEVDGLPFRGFPLTKEFLDFLKYNGDSSGYITVAPESILEEVPRLSDNLGVTSSVRQVALESVSRYDDNFERYLDVFTKTGQVFSGFYDPGNYEIDQNGILVVPAVRVSKERPRNMFFVRTGLLELTLDDEAEYSTHANPYEFFIALILKAHEADR